LLANVYQLGARKARKAVQYFYENYWNREERGERETKLFRFSFLLAGYWIFAGTGEEGERWVRVWIR
jgi:hypothetical protein